MGKVTTATRVSTRASLAFVLLATAIGATRAEAAAAPPCAGLRLQAGTLQTALTLLGKEKGFEVSFGNDKVAKLEVKAGPLDGKTCLAAMTRFLEELNLNFALAEGPGKSIKRIVVVDFKSTLPADTASRTAAAPEAAEAAPEVKPEEPPTPEAEPGPRKDKEPPTEDELIDMGDGMKMFKVPPPYVPMTPGLIPPNAVPAGPEVLGESYHGAESAQPNAVLVPTTTTGPAPAPPAKGSPFPGSPVPPNVPQPKPKPTPQS
ncbi:MAG TPA: hypothetical protein PLD86_05820 [Vicinamibacteria bacterium]|nr:hypothetical protein [Vicinamibacteria bacterium]